MNFPSELLYSKSHEWIKTLDNGNILIGITDFAQDALGDLVFINLPLVGDTVKAEDAFCDVESVKAVSDVFSPADGNIVAVNDALADNPALLNDDPYGAWIVELENAVVPEGLLDATEYEAFCKEEQ